MQQQANGIKVLIVDDEPNIVQFLTMGLANEGYQVIQRRRFYRIDEARSPPAWRDRARPCHFQIDRRTPRRNDSRSQRSRSRLRVSGLPA